MNYPEVFYQRAVLTHLSLRGFSVREEVAYGRKRFDALAYDGIYLLGIEVKCRDWKRAIRQARYQKLCCDMAAVALPAGKVSEELLKEASIFGLGVIAIGDAPTWSLEWKLAAHPSPAVEAHRSRILAIGGWCDVKPKY